MAILGLSSSPFVGGNTDMLVKAVLKKSSSKTIFVNLSRLSFDPCRGYCHLSARYGKILSEL